jgi:murein DD-endopeptidase MepM/ murein hydrolase activator NlpD
MKFPLFYRLFSSSFKKLLIAGSVISMVAAACAPTTPRQSFDVQTQTEQAAQLDSISPTPLPTRPAYDPGELVDYTVQPGDTLPALISRFNTSEAEIREANPILPAEVTTLPPGMPMQIPIYYQPLWGSSYQILPDRLFAYGPPQVGFNTVEFVNSQPGWLKEYQGVAGGMRRSGGELVEIVATNFSISPRLLLALIEYQTQGLTNPQPPDPEDPYVLGYRSRTHPGLYQQLLWAANLLNDAFYSYRLGKLTSFEHPDGRLERPDPWQNAASVTLQYYFSRMMDKEDYFNATHSQGLEKTYAQLFGDPWSDSTPTIPGSLQQPELRFPFLPGKAWAYTGGPHTGWGTDQPYAAIDFAPPNVVGGCAPTDEWSTAIADGTIVRTDTGVAVLDLDGDLDERTGWVIFYLHLATKTTPPVGTSLKAGDPIGQPSCDGGKSTGTHVHIARKYNGEWVPADSPVPFNLEGWIAKNGGAPYQGQLVQFGKIITACECSDRLSLVQSTVNIP